MPIEKTAFESNRIISIVLADAGGSQRLTNLLAALWKYISKLPEAVGNALLMEVSYRHELAMTVERAEESDASMEESLLQSSSSSGSDHGGSGTTQHCSSSSSQSHDGLPSDCCQNRQLHMAVRRTSKQLLEDAQARFWGRKVMAVRYEMTVLTELAPVLQLRILSQPGDLSLEELGIIASLRKLWKEAPTEFDQQWWTNWREMELTDFPTWGVFSRVHETIEKYAAVLFLQVLQDPLFDFEHIGKPDHVALVRQLAASSYQTLMFILMHEEMKRPANVNLIRALLADIPFQFLWFNPLFRPGQSASPGNKPGGVLTTHSAADTDEKQCVQKFGTAFGCHTCGVAQWCPPDEEKYIADHQPPSELLRLFASYGNATAVTQRSAQLRLKAEQAEHNPTRLIELWTRMTALGGQQLYPHCERCSVLQAGVTKNVIDILKKLMQVSKKEKLQLLFHDLEYYLESLLDANLLRAGHLDTGIAISANYADTAPYRQGIQVVGATTKCHSCGGYGQFWTSDHQPPVSFVSDRHIRQAPMVLYPQCVACSNTQRLMTARVATEMVRISRALH